MRKCVLAILCLVALLFAGIDSSLIAKAETESYQVGYSIRDLNPWVDYNDHSKGIQQGLFNLTGNQNDSERPLEQLFDDNGDGVRGEGDGIYTTATAVTDYAGKTIIYITIDSLQGYAAITNDVRTTIVERLGNSVISGDQIMVNGSHSHSSAPFSSLKGKAGEKGIYYDYVISQITEAAVEAYNDRAAAKMSKGTVDAKEATAALNYNKGQGFHMNAIRHYETTMTNKNNTKEKKHYLTWSGDTLDKQSEYPFVTSGTNKKTHEPVEESDNNMHVLLFEFPENPDKQPVVFVNWRAHTTMNSGVEKKSLSSDYVNGLRTTLAKQGYRAAFFQGAAGNVVTAAKEGVWSAFPVYKDWFNYVDDQLKLQGLTVNATNRNAKKTFIYGKMLANIAMYCIGNHMQELPAGRIRNIQVTWRGVLQPYTDGHLAAALETKAIEEAGGTIEYPYRYNYEGETYILNSNYHRNAVISRSTAAETYTDLELNAITLGDEVAFVTAPNELADKFYVYSEGEKYSFEKNDWNNLINEATYGTPFVLGYTNDGRGYIASWLDHMMNSQTYTDITGFGENGEEFFDPGTYESNTSRLAQGQGEALVKQMGDMLKFLKTEFRTSYCNACQKEVEWEPILEAQARNLSLGTGHYYLYEDISAETTNSNRFKVAKGVVLCLDLNGHKVETESRSIYMTDKGSTINLFDSKGSGELISYSGGNNVGGGACSVASGTTLNIYGGTIRFIAVPGTKTYETGNGAVISCSGTVNMYGGTLIGGDLYMSSYYASTNTTNGCGGTVFLGSSGKFNISGGRIIAGQAAEGGRGDCIYLHDSTGRVTVSGDAEIDEVYLSSNNGKQLTIKDTFTGRLAINVKNDPAVGTKVATLSKANVDNATLTYITNSEYMLKPSGSYLVTGTRTSGVAVVLDNYIATVYDDLNNALKNSGDGFVTLLTPVTTDVSVSKDAYLNLNGNSITGKVSVASGKTLYCMDSETDDYDVADNKYGRITQLSGNIAAIDGNSDIATDGYLMVNEADGISFHRVNLQLSAMTLRADQAGLFYKSNFAGDQVVARNVDRFGVALSIHTEPNATNLEDYCKYSWFEGFTAGVNGNDATSTLLKNVMKPENGDFINYNNANIPIYGRAYIKLFDGSYLFGNSACRTFRQQLEDVNDIISGLSEEQMNSVTAFCRQYIDLLRDWEISNILSYEAAHDDVLKIFAIGNNYAVDSLHMLREVYQAENPDKQVILGYAYKNGCTVAQHVECLNGDLDDYTYYEVAADGTHSTTEKVTLKTMLQDENWDVVTLQQESSESGMAETYNGDITKVYNYATKCLGYTPKYGWNMTWSYPARVDANAEAFDYYGSQEAMFEKIVKAVQSEIVTDETITYLMPVGLALQNARTYYTNRTDLHRDAYGHLNDFSRLMAAYVWYCELEGVVLESIKMDTIPAALTTSYTNGDLVLTDVQQQVLIQSVNNALVSQNDQSFAVVPVTIAK